ncbi:hypothetical protein J6O48_05005 [bacterium]|nr:hypothetical protein [bacterium]
MYAKFINESTIELPPKNKGSVVNYNNNERLLIADGYKPLIKDENIISGRLYSKSYTQDETNIYEHLNYIESEEDFNKRTEQIEIQNQINRLNAEINELDIKRIRAVCEPSIKDEETGETWLDYYNNLVIAIREQINTLRERITPNDITNENLPPLDSGQ